MTRPAPTDPMIPPIYGVGCLLGGIVAASRRGKARTSNKPSRGTKADKRLKGNGGKKPGPKPKRR